MRSKQGRFLELEGLRGLAAVTVVAYHFILGFYTFAFFGAGNGRAQNVAFESLFYGHPAMVFLSGTFAVAIFFVLSGFVLSIGFFQTRKLDIIKKLAAKRYLRLMLPSLASVLIAYALIKTGLSFAHEAAELSSSSWLAATWTVVPQFFDALYSGVIGAFTQPSNPYNSVLWTMSIEFLGSFFVFGFLALFADAKYKPLLYAGLLALTFNTWFMGFIAGMILADLYASGHLRQVKRKLLYVVPFIVAGLFLGGFPVGPVKHTVYENFVIPGLELDWKILYLTLGAVLIIGVVLSTAQLAKILRMKWISILGKYSFSLYLVHGLVLFTLTTFLFVTFQNDMGIGYNRSFVYATLLSVPVVMAVTYLFERYVDARSVKFSSWVAAIVLGEKKFSAEFLSAYSGSYERAFRKFARVNAKTAALQEQETD